MKRILLVTSYLLLVTSILGCAALRQMVQPTTGVEAAVLPSYSGPQAKIAVADFEVKAGKATGESGLGLRQILITALTNSNRFKIAEHADLIIRVSVTEFEPEASGGSAGVGGGGGVGSGAMGGLLGGALNKAHMALEIRIVDTSTSQVLATTEIQGQASDASGTIMAGVFGKHGLSGDLSIYANTPMEKAIRICIIEAVRYISQNIPERYYGKA